MTYDEYVAVIIMHLAALKRELGVYEYGSFDKRHFERRIERLLQVVDAALLARSTTPTVP